MVRRKRSREKEEFWRWVLSEFESSGQTVRQFCQAQGLSEPSFYSWRREIARRDAKSAASSESKTELASLVPITLVDTADPDPANALTPSDSSRASIEVLTPSGVVVRFDESVAKDRLHDVIGFVTQLERGGLQ